MTEFAAARTLRERVDLVGSVLGEAQALVFLQSGADDAPSATYSFAEFARDIRKKAAALRQLGVAQGEVVAAFLPLSPTSYQALFAAMATGVVAPLNYLLEPAALIHLMERLGASVLLTASEAAEDPAFAGKIASIRQALPHVRHIVFGGGAQPAGSLDLDAASDAMHGAWPDDLPDDVSRDMVLMLTGGTTGRPKIVPHTEAQYLALLESSAPAQGMTRGERVLSPLPLFHTSGTLTAGLIPILSGAGIVVPSARGFRDPDVVRRYWELTERYGVTVGAAVPTALAGIAANAPRGAVTSMRHILAGGSPVPQATMDAIRDQTGVEVVNGWGMTETCGFSVLNPLDQPRHGSVGRPNRGVSIEIRLPGDDGKLTRVAAIGAAGELVVRGETVIMRYLDDRPDSFTPDGWLRTGDLGRLDEDGYLTLTGRVKDLIIRGGHNIDPVVIEDAAYEHPAVQIAAAVGQLDAHAGELPILFVELRQGQAADPAEILSFLKTRIPERAAVPKAVHVVDALPLSGPGKISKLALRLDLARRVLQTEIDRIIGAGEVAVQVTDDPRHGLVAELFILRPTSLFRPERLEQALGPFGVVVRWSEVASL